MFYLTGDSEDRFSDDTAHIRIYKIFPAKCNIST